MLGRIESSKIDWLIQLDLISVVRFNKSERVGCERVYDEISKIAPKQQIFGEHTFTHDFFDPYWPPELFPTREHAKKKVFFVKRDFSFFALFSLFLYSTQSEFRR